MNVIDVRALWSRILTIAGGIGMVVGALDPLEGSLLILPGSGLLALGAYLGQAEHRTFVYRVWAFVLVLIGVGALWGLSMMGGFGGSSGRSNWWGMLLLPYFIGWSMGIWGAGSPRWMTWVGIGVGLWYLFLESCSWGWRNLGIAIILTTMGILTIIGCTYRLCKRPKVKEKTEA